MTSYQFVLEKGDRADVQNVVLVITDGVSTYDNQFTIPDAVNARNKGIDIYSIGISAKIDENELRLMSSLPQEKDKNYFTTTSFEALDGITKAILTETCRIQGSDKLYCKDVGDNGNQCFCTYDACDIRPTNSTQCVDIDECALNNGNCQQTCTDTPGSYLCACTTGFALRDDLSTCKDVNECLNNPCFGGQLCINTYGSYVCVNNGGAAQGLVAEDNSNAVEAVADGNSVTMATVVSSSVLSAVVAILSAVAIVLAIRFGRRRCQGSKSDTASTSRFNLSGSSTPSVRNTDNFGFSTVNSKFSGRPSGASEDSESAVDMNF